MAVFVAEGSKTSAISDARLRALVKQTISQFADGRSAEQPRRLLLLPPDITRLNSMAGRITEIVWEEYGASCRIDIMPALGTHNPMNGAQLDLMFGKKIPKSAFRVHDWRRDVRSVGIVPSSVIEELSRGKLHYSVNVEVNKILFDGYDAILSIGQVVPHEVAGLSSHAKNIFVGAGGSDMINKSHFLGAVCGLETMMGRADTPVRRLYNYAADNFLAELPVVHLLTVMERGESGEMAMRGFFSGTGIDVFNKAAELCVATNIVLLEKPLDKVVAFLDPAEFTSTWLGNKAIYRTRMAIADGGELIVLAPGLERFGEDKTMDALIRKYGYFGTERTISAVDANEDLRENLGAAAHLIHGSSEGRFKITYCPGRGVSADEIRAVGFEYGDLDEMRRRYKTESLKDGFNTVNGETIFYIANPALGLWALRGRDAEPSSA